jgi:hypothetical protein
LRWAVAEVKYNRIRLVLLENEITMVLVEYRTICYTCIKVKSTDSIFKCQIIEEALAMGRKPIFWVIGGPGSGKGTQCVRLAEKFKLAHISSGDLLRAEVASNSPQGKEINSLMLTGQLVPREIGTQIIFPMPYPND